MRDARSLAERLGAPLYVPPPDQGDRTRSRGTCSRALRPLLELPVELVLPTHGAPTDRAALERAVS